MTGREVGGEVPSLRKRLRQVRITRSAMWVDAEFLCHALGDGLDALSMAAHRLGGRCYGRAKAARARADARREAHADRLDREAAERADPTPHDLDQWND